MLMRHPTAPNSTQFINHAAGRVGSSNHSLPIMCLGPDSSLAGAGGAGRTLSVLPPLALNFSIEVGAFLLLNTCQACV